MPLLSCSQITAFVWKEAPDYGRPWPPQWRIRSHRGNGHSHERSRVLAWRRRVPCERFPPTILRPIRRPAQAACVACAIVPLMRVRSMALWRKSHRPPLRRNATFARKPSCFFRQLPSGGGRWPVHAVLLDGGGLVVRCRARVREAAFPYALYFRDSRSTILYFTFDTVASDRWISAFLAWPLLSTTSIPRRVSGCAVTSLRASLLDRCWCAAGCLWRAARGDTR